MNINKKYAIRKLAVGVASVGIGLFVANSTDISQSLGTVKNEVVLAAENESKVIYSNPNANGVVDENGTNNNAISKIEVVNETDKKVRLRISIVDDVDVSKGFVLKTFKTLYAGFNEPLSFNNEQVGTIPYVSNTIKKVKKPNDFSNINEYYSYLQSLDSQSDEVNGELKLKFNEKFKKYDKNRVLEFDLEISRDTSVIDFLHKKNETSNEKTKMLEDYYKNVKGNIYINNNKIYTMKNPTKLKLTIDNLNNNIQEKEYNESDKINRAGSGAVAVENRPTYLSNLFVSDPTFNRATNDGSIYINATNKKVLKAGTNFRVKLNSNVVEFKGNNNEVVKGNLKYKENTPTKFEEKEIFKGEQLIEKKVVEKPVMSYYDIPVNYTKIDNNTYELEVLEDVVVKADSLREHEIELPNQIYSTKLREDFLNHLNIDEYKNALKTGKFGNLFGTITTEIKEPNDTDYTQKDVSPIRAWVATSYVFGESSTGTVKVKYVDENNKEISSLETIVENQSWYNKVDVPKKDLPGYEFVSSSQPLNDLVMSGERTITLTYRSVEKTREIPFKTIYQADETKDKGIEEIVVNGENGIEGYKETDKNYSRIIKEKIDKVVKIGTKPKVEVEVITSPIRYEKDTSRDKDQENITIKGKDGSKTTRTTYTVNSDNGKIEEHPQEPVIVSPTETVIKVAAKDKVVYSKDGNNIIKETTTYEVNSKTGEITENTTRETFKENGAKDKVVVEKIPSPIRYEKDTSRDKGQENITVQGKDGSKTTTTTYTVNSENGETIPNVKDPVVVEPTITVVKVAAKDKVVFSKDGNNIIKETTTYIVNPENGNITENTTREIFKENGAKDKVVVEKIPSPIRYEKDDSRDKGQENITIQGKEGSKTTTTTYTVNPENGEVEEHPQNPVIVNPTETIIKVAAKDKVEIVNKEDGSVIKETTTYTVNPKTGEITESKREEIIKGKTETSKGTENPPVVESLPEFTGGANLIDTPVVENLTEIKVALIKDKENNILDVIKLEEEPKEMKGYKNTGKTEVDKDGYKVYIYEKIEETSKGEPEVLESPKEFVGGVNPNDAPVVENKDFVGGVNPSDSPIREELPELKVAIIKDKENNILDVIKLEEQPKEIKGYKNTGKTEIDKDGYKVYIYEKVENVKPETKETPIVKENKVDIPKEDNKENKKEVINKKEELPKTSTAMLSTVGLFSIFGLRKNRKKDKK